MSNINTKSRILPNNIISMIKYVRENEKYENSSFKNQYDNLNEYNEVNKLRDTYIEYRDKLINCLPKNSWVKFNIDGEDVGVINLYYKFANGIGIETWNEKMPYPRSYASKLLIDYIFKKYKWFIIIFAVIFFLWIFRPF